LRRAGIHALVLIAILAIAALILPSGQANDPPKDPSPRGLPNDPSSDPPALRPYPGTGMFLLLSDLHFDPYSDRAIMEQLGAKPLAPCQSAAPTAFSKYGRDTNLPLLKSALDQAARAAAENHFHYDYAIITGDFLAHNFDTRFAVCVGGDTAAYQKFVIATLDFVNRMIAKTLPGVPVFAALGNNDSDAGDYATPSAPFLQSVGSDWSRRWGTLPAAERASALASFERAGNYAVPHPTVPGNELVIVNSNFWAAHNAFACGAMDPDPGGQFQWLTEVLGRVKRAGGSATLVMHILPGVDAIKTALGTPKTLWTDRCTEKFVAELSDFRGVVREIYAGHIHRDDFRILPDRDGKPNVPIHVVPAVSPIYLNNPGVEIGWYDKRTGELRDFAPQYLDLGSSKPTWATEYVFSRAFGQPRPNLATLEELSRAIHEGNPKSGVGRQYSRAYGVGIGWFMTPENWSIYSCAQTEITMPRFMQCTRAGATHKP
jgi:hypothetical protein